MTRASLAAREKPTARERRLEAVCIGAALLAAVFAALLLCAGGRGSPPAYASALFDRSYVHTIDLQLPDWEGFIRDAPTEEYRPCTVVIDGETFRQVGLRAKGNNSLRLTEDYGLSRYSLKLEFDHYLSGGNYHGLDKLSLDASFQDNSYLKTYLAYDMMAFMGVPTPLCSYVKVTVNGQDWGLFLAVEEPEEAFARRNFGPAHGALYKPDYRSLQEENADLALRYLGDDPALYPALFENELTAVTGADRRRLVRALRGLDGGQQLEQWVMTDLVLRYFAVQVFVMNWDSYLGYTGHNYLLYEQDGRVAMLPWDYNLAFGTYALGKSEPVRDAGLLINSPIYTPAEGEVMLRRPLYHLLMQQPEFFSQYRSYFDLFLSDYVESGRLARLLRETQALIGPYVRDDPTAFCSYADHLRAVDMLEQICLLRAQSARLQLQGEIPATIRGQLEQPQPRVDASAAVFADLGDFADLTAAKPRQDAALARVAGAG